MNKKILITGSNGFIGQRLINSLKDKNVDLILLDHHISDSSQFKPIKCSILERNEVCGVIQQYDPDIIVHLAAIASPVYDNLSELYAVNVCGTDNLLYASKLYGKDGLRIILMSTAGVYGNQSECLNHEDMQCRPVNHYAYSKLINEMMVYNYSDLDIYILRPFTIVGKGQRNTFLIPKLVEAFITQKKVIKLGNLNARRDYVSVDFCSSIIAEVALRDYVPYKILNICSGIGYTVSDVLEILINITGFRPEIVIDENLIRKNEIWSMVGSTERLSKFAPSNFCDHLHSILSELIHV